VLVFYAGSVYRSIPDPVRVQVAARVQVTIRVAISEAIRHLAIPRLGHSMLVMMLVRVSEVSLNLDIRDSSIGRTRSGIEPDGPERHHARVETQVKGRDGTRPSAAYIRVVYGVGEKPEFDALVAEMEEGHGGSVIEDIVLGHFAVS
jgi:hypothetical protein